MLQGLSRNVNCTNVIVKPSLKNPPFAILVTGNEPNTLGSDLGGKSQNIAEVQMQCQLLFFFPFLLSLLLQNKKMHAHPQNNPLPDPFGLV